MESLLWWPTCRLSPDQPRILLTTSSECLQAGRASTELKLPHQGGCPPTKAKMLFSASVSHSRKPANSRLLWEPDKDKDDADKGGSGQTQSRHRDNSSPLRALPPKRSPGWS